MRRSRIIAHRGFWSKPDEKNSPAAFSRALAEGFGIETDFRDLDGALVISHDPARSGALSAADFLAQCAAASGTGLLALNIKADGLQGLIANAVTTAQIEPARTFVFDMSVPDARGYRDGPLPVYERISDYEPSPPLTSSTSGVWSDNFFGAVDQIAEALKYLEFGLAATVVSPELHGRPYVDVWRRIRQAGLHEHEDFSLCSDRPGDALVFFEETR